MYVPGCRGLGRPGRAEGRGVAGGARLGHCGAQGAVAAGGAERGQAGGPTGQRGAVGEARGLALDRLQAGAGTQPPLRDKQRRRGGQMSEASGCAEGPHDGPSASHSPRGRAVAPPSLAGSRSRPRRAGRRTGPWRCRTSLHVRTQTPHSQPYGSPVHLRRYNHAVSSSSAALPSLTCGAWQRRDGLLGAVVPDRTRGSAGRRLQPGRLAEPAAT